MLSKEIEGLYLAGSPICGTGQYRVVQGSTGSVNQPPIGWLVWLVWLVCMLVAVQGADAAHVRRQLAADRRTSSAPRCVPASAAGKQDPAPSAPARSPLPPAAGGGWGPAGRSGWAEACRHTETAYILASNCRDADELCYPAACNQPQRRGAPCGCSPPGTPAASCCPGPCLGRGPRCAAGRQADSTRGEQCSGRGHGGGSSKTQKKTLLDLQYKRYKMLTWQYKSQSSALTLIILCIPSRSSSPHSSSSGSQLSQPATSCRS